MVAFLRTFSQQIDLGCTVKHLSIGVLPRDIILPELLYPIPENNAAGTILDILPSLQILGVGTPRACGNSFYHSNSRFSMDYFFGGPAKGTLIPSCDSLTSLYWSSWDSPEGIACLPKLQKLTVNMECKMPDVSQWSRRSNIDTLEILRCIWVLISLAIQNHHAWRNEHLFGVPRPLQINQQAEGLSGRSGTGRRRLLRGSQPT